MGEWTIETLREHVCGQIADLRYMLDERATAQMKALDAALVAQQASITKSENAAERRFESVNEFRGQLADQATHFINRTEAEVRLQSLADKLQTVGTVSARAMSQDQFIISHDALRILIDTERAALAEYKTWSTKTYGDLSAALSNLRSRWAGVSVGLGVIMTVLIALVTVVGLVK